jgi:hypothetical protein
MQARIAAMTTAKKSSVLNNFINRRMPMHVATELGIEPDLVQYIYDKLDEIQERCKACMRGEIVITPAVLDAQGNVVTPAVMNTPPATQAALSTTVQPQFTDFTSAEFTAILNAIMKWCKFDGTGAWAFYKTQIIL